MSAASSRTERVRWPATKEQSRDVPGSIQVMGLEIATNSVTVNGSTAYRKGEYFGKEISVANSSVPVWQSITVAAPSETSVTGNVFVAKTAETFGYDADGNLTSDGRWGYLWDGENRLIGMFARNAVGPANSLKFEYDWKSRRIHKQVFANTNWTSTATNDLRFAYDGWNLLDEISGGGTQVRGYLWGLDLSGTMRRAGGVGGLLEVNDPTNGTAFAAFDGNGNVAALVSTAGGTNVARYDYGPFGEVLRSTGPLAEPNCFRFSTKGEDDESHALYYGIRFYQPSAGGWMSRDRIAEAGGLNIRGFVLNNPVSRFDPSGEQSAFVWGGPARPAPCRLDLDYDFVPRETLTWYERLNQPIAVQYVQHMKEISDDIAHRIKNYDPFGDCCKGSCVASLSISAHGGGDGVIPLGQGDQYVAGLSNLADVNPDELSDMRRRWREEFLRARDFMRGLSSRMCRNAHVSFVVCEAGGGAAGRALPDQLKQIFGPGVDVQLFTGGACYRYGYPSSSRIRH